MSRGRFIDADVLWMQIDEWAHSLQLKSEFDVAQSSECYKMFLLGKKELLDLLCDFVSEEQKELEDIANTLGIDMKEKKYDE